MEQMSQDDLHNSRIVEWSGGSTVSYLREMSYPFDLDDVSPVRVKPMASVVRKLAKRIVQQKACYYNAATMMFSACRPDMKYVIGYASAPIPTDHAWLKVGDTYYDPTWELCLSQLGKEYLPIYELDMEDLVKVMNTMDTLEPPCALKLFYFKNRNNVIRQLGQI